MNIWNEIVVLDYVLSQGYSEDVKKDEARLIELRFRYDRYLKLTNLQRKIQNG